MENFLEKLRDSIIEDVKKLPKESEHLLRHLDDIQKVEDPRFWNAKGVDIMTFLRTKIAPLMKYQSDVQLKPSSFVLKCENLLFTKLELSSNPDWIEQPLSEKIINEICEAVTRLPPSINEVREKQSLIDSLLYDKSYWKNIDVDKILQIRDELAPLMIYQQSEPVRVIQIRMNDVIQQRGTIRYGPDMQEDHVEVYREKVEKKIRELADKNPAIQKIKNNQTPTDEELETLERDLMSSELNITEENLRKAFDRPSGSFVDFIKVILGLLKFPNPRDLIEEAFSAHLIKKNYMNPDQIDFIRILESVLLSKKHVEYKDFFDSPFTELGSASPTPLFKKEELLEMVGLCKVLEKEAYGVC